MLTLSELQRKEVVRLHTGEKLGFVDDLEINEQEGIVTSIIVVDRQMKGSFFNKLTETFISWDQIVTIGTDIILINHDDMTKNTLEKQEKTD